MNKIVPMMDFISIRVREDNLMYLFFDDSYAFSFDSYLPNVILHAISCDFDKQNYLQSEILQLEKTKNRKLLYSFTTHGHFDHNGGDCQLKSMYPQVEMINFTNKRSICVDKFTINCIETPCHTLDSLCYLIKNTETEKVYVVTGDFIFKLGCGRFFEGDALMFISSLDYLLSFINKDALFLYGHDYFDANKRFAEKFYPIEGCENFFLTLEEEMKSNPFFRPVDIKSVTGTREEKIKKLREMKNNFK